MDSWLYFQCLKDVCKVERLPVIVVVVGHIFLNEPLEIMPFDEYSQHCLLLLAPHGDGVHLLASLPGSTSIQVKVLRSLWNLRRPHQRQTLSSSSVGLTELSFCSKSIASGVKQVGGNFALRIHRLVFKEGSEGFINLTHDPTRNIFLSSDHHSNFDRLCRPSLTRTGSFSNWSKKCRKFHGKF